MYDVGYTTSSMVLLGVIAMVATLIIILSIVIMWRLFAKAGVPGWYSIIPIWSAIQMCLISRTNPFLLLLYFVPFAGIFVSISLVMNFIRSYNSSVLLCVLGIFFPFIVFPIIAFSPSHMYTGR